MTKLLRKLFPSLFKWKIPHYEPVNSFERALQEAKSDPGARPGTLRKMFHFDVYVMGKVNSGEGSKPVLEFQEFTKPVSYRHVRAFSSEDAFRYLFRLVKQDPPSFIRIPLIRLFTLSEGEYGVILNMGLPFSVSFSPEEIKRILDDKESLGESTSLRAGQTYQVGHPARIPDGFQEALRSYGTKNTNCKNIYLGLMTHPDESLSYVIAIEFWNENRSSNPPDALVDLQVIAQSFQFDFPVDVCEARDFILDFAYGGYMIATFPERV